MAVSVFLSCSFPYGATVEIGTFFLQMVFVFSTDGNQKHHWNRSSACFGRVWIFQSYVSCRIFLWINLRKEKIVTTSLYDLLASVSLTSLLIFFLQCTIGIFLSYYTEKQKKNNAYFPVHVIHFYTE